MAVVPRASPDLGEYTTQTPQGPRIHYMHEPCA